MKETNLSLPPHSFFCPITLELNGQSAGSEIEDRDRRKTQEMCIWWTEGDME